MEALRQPGAPVVRILLLGLAQRSAVRLETSVFLARLAPTAKQHDPNLPRVSRPRYAYSVLSSRDTPSIYLLSSHTALQPCAYESHCSPLTQCNRRTQNPTLRKTWVMSVHLRPSCTTYLYRCSADARVASPFVFQPDSCEVSGPSCAVQFD